MISLYLAADTAGTKTFSRKGIDSKILVIAVVIVLVVAGLAVAFYTAGGAKTTTTSSTSSSTGTLNTLTAVTGTGYTDTTIVNFNSGGSSFVGPIMAIWIDRFTGYTDGRVNDNYQTIGSQAGQQGFFDGTFNFAGSDAPVIGSQLANISKANPGNTLLEFPDALGAVTIFYNIPQIGNTSIDLTGPILAGIYNESITKWDAPAITALNPGIDLPNQTIIPVHRADGSGTTYALTTYLNQIDPQWNSTIGVGLIVNWPANELAATGSAGVAGDVSDTPYSIGYADQYYARSNSLTVASVENSSGNFIQPTQTAIANAASDFTSQLQTNPLTPISNAPGAQSYPISAFTYILVWKNQSNPDDAYALYWFFSWVVNEAQGYGSPLGFPPLPQNIVTIDNGIISQINYNGQTYTT